MTSRSTRSALRVAAAALALHGTFATAQTVPFKPAVLHRFLGTADAGALGGTPEVPPVLGLDGVLQGVTRNGGPPVNLILGQGVGYRIDPARAGSYTATLLGDVAVPSSTLVVGATGTVYGGTATSNFNNPPNSITSTAAAYTLKNGVPALLFQPSAGPRGQLAIDEQDRLYVGRAGTVVACSATTRAPLHRLSPDGTETTVIDFCQYYTETTRGVQLLAKGGVPVSAVWSRADQALYVLTSVGARGVFDPTATSDNSGRSVGTLVRLDKAALDAGAANGGLVDEAQVQVLHTFLRNRDGEPTAAGGRVNGLVEAGDWLYGTSYSNPTTSGTTNAEEFSGTLWRVKKTDPSTFTVVHRFRGTATVGLDGSATGDGGTPNGPLVFAADGNVYGTTARDASVVYTSASGAVLPMGGGTLFRVVAGTAADRSDDRYEVLHRFDVATEGGRPVGLTAGAVAGGVQKLYGAATYGGSGETVSASSSQITGNGTVFSFDVPLPTAAFTTALSASAATARVGDRITLTWATDNVTTCTAGGDNGGTWQGAQQASASAVPLAAALSKLGDNTFTLSCESVNGGPAIAQSVTVTVEAQPVVVPPVVDAGGDSGGGAIAPWLLAPFAGLLGLLFATRRRRG